RPRQGAGRDGHRPARRRRRRRARRARARAAPPDPRGLPRAPAGAGASRDLRRRRRGAGRRPGGPHAMKITAIDTYVLRVPTRSPTPPEFADHRLVVADIRTDDGPTGLGYSLAFGGGGAEAIQVYLETRLKPLVMNEDPLFVERLWERMYRADRGIKRQ